MSNLTGREIRGYELREQIGTGGFGEVYLAFQAAVGREVAVKVILPHHASHPDFIRRFETEAQLVARLEHLHIVPLYDYWRDADGAFLVMRFLRGGSLRNALARGPYGLNAASLLLDQVGSGLALAHRNNVIHRDLKPDNILLDEDGNAYIADFGIAKNIGAPGEGITQPGALIGTADYLAPELAHSIPVTPQTDIYALGIILYEMITGMHPYQGAAPLERLLKHLHDPVPIIPGLEPEVSKGVNAVIQKATAKDPLQRFADGLAIAAAFREAIGVMSQRLTSRIFRGDTQRDIQIAPSPSTLSDLEQQLAQARRMDDKRRMFQLYSELAGRYHDLGQFNKVIDCYNNAITISRDVGDRRSEMIWVTHLGNFYAGRYESYQAFQLYKLALAIADERTDTLARGQILYNMGLTYADQERIADARRLLNEAHRLFEETGEVDLINQAREQLDLLG